MNVYAVPFVKPDTLQDSARVVEHDNPSGLDTTVYPEIGTPPSNTGATHDTTDEPFKARTAVTPVGALGAVNGTAAADERDATEEPDAFEATTVNVYDVPFVRPITVQLVMAVTQVSEPGDEVTVYVVIAAPPSVNGADHEIETDPSSAESTETSRGATGTVDGIAAADSSEAEPVPRAFVAVTVNV